MSDVLTKFWAGLLGLLLLGLLWTGVPYIASAYHLDRGIRLLEDDAEPRVAIDQLETAVRLEPGNTQAHRWLAKAYLRAGQPERAIAPAQQALSLSSDSPLVKLEMGDVYDDLGDAEGAITFYEAGWVGDRRPQLLVNYLQLADESWMAGDRERARDICRDKVLGYGYADLYAAWRLFQYYADDEGNRDFYRQQLTRFPETSILLSNDSRMASYQMEALAGIIGGGLWNRDTTLNVLAYQAWHSDPASAGRSLLYDLAELFPEDADVWYHLGESYRRQGKPQLAEQAYLNTVGIDPGYATAYLRLGALSEARSANGGDQEWLAQAAKWYQQYQQLAPDDPLALKKLADVCELSCSSENIWLTQLKDHLAQREPEILVGQEFDNWRLLGYHADEARLVRGEPTALWLYWQPLADVPDMPDCDDCYQVGERWVQVVEGAQNLVTNFIWQGPDTASMKDLSRVAPPLTVSGYRGDFAFSHISAASGDAIRVSPVPRDTDGGERAIQFGLQLEDAGTDLGLRDYSLKGRGDDLGIQEGQMVIMTLWVRVSPSSGRAHLFVQDKTEAWERSKTSVERTGWQPYAVARKIRREAAEVWMGIHWQPGTDQEWLETRGMIVLVAPLPPEWQP